MSNENENKRPSHIAYQVREGEENKSYFNRIGAVWPHKDGEGYNIELDSFPKDGKIVVRSVQERLQEAKDNAREPAPVREERREPARNETSRSSREDRAPRDSGPRYER